MNGPRGHQSPVVILSSCPEQKGRFLIDRKNSSLGEGTGPPLSLPYIWVVFGGILLLLSEKGSPALLTIILHPKKGLIFLHKIPRILSLGSEVGRGSVVGRGAITAWTGEALGIPVKGVCS